MLTHFLHVVSNNSRIIPAKHPNSADFSFLKFLSGAGSAEFGFGDENGAEWYLRFRFGWIFCLGSVSVVGDVRYLHVFCAGCGACLDYIGI